MRVVALDLIAFGPFSGIRLDFGGAEGVHLVHGRNEAGKSTARRALTALLFGIPQRTPDGHKHALTDLRIGGVLRASDGSTASFVRRKGAKKTLLDPDGTALDEHALAHLLGGIDETAFAAAFALDHETLRRGAEALLAGHGAVGESLFDAGIGGRGVRALLAQLEDEQRGIFVPNGSKPELNVALRQFKDARERLRKDALGWEKWQAQVDGLTEARAALDSLLRERRERAVERQRLERAVRVCGPLARRDELRSERAALGDVALLPAVARSERGRLEREAAAAESQIAGCHEQIARLERLLGELQVPAALVALAKSDLDALEALRSKAEAAEADLPKRRGELAAQERSISTTLGRLGSELTAARAGELRVSPATQAKARKLVRIASGLAETLAGKARALDSRKRELDAARTTRQSGPPVHDTAGLDAAVERALGAGDVDAKIASLTAEIDALVVQARARAIGLAGPSADPAALSVAPVPARGAVDRALRAVEELERAEHELEQRDAETRARLLERERELAALVGSAHLPTEQDLLDARAERDAVVSEVVRGPSLDVRASERLAPAIVHADGIADRLRHDADRVARLAELSANRAQIVREIDALPRGRAALVERRREHTRGWEQLWEGTGVAARAPESMLSWLEAHAALCADTDTLTAKHRELEGWTTIRAELLASLHEETADAYAGDGDRLAPVLAMARRLCAAAERANRQRDALDARISTLETETSAGARELDEAATAIAAWRSELDEAAARLWLPAGATPEEVEAQLEALGELATSVADAESLRERIAAMEADIEAFAREAVALAARHTPELVGTDANPHACARALFDAHDDARTRLQLRSTHEAELGAARATLDAALLAHDGARRGLDALVRAARVRDPSELAEAEHRSERAAWIDETIATIDSDLRREAADAGVSLEALAEDVRALGPDAARARLVEIASIDDDDEHTSRVSRVNAVEAGFTALGTSSAAEAAMDTEEALARVDALARRYARARVAAFVLRREVERYRERNQGPLVLRASALFAGLTADEWTGLAVDFGADDEPVLRCVRADGLHVDVDGLSDGTRDALYFALRLATFEQYVQKNEPLPLVLDDVLVHLDDQRTARALAVLGEVGAHAQILLFTHHERVVELARATVPAALLHLHDLDALRTTPAATSDAPVDA